jgi:hypothetical protein
VIYIPPNLIEPIQISVFPASYSGTNVPWMERDLGLEFSQDLHTLEKDPPHTYSPWSIPPLNPIEHGRVS